MRQLHILRNIPIHLMFLALFGTFGCSDLLDKEPPSSISEASFWSNENDAYLALVGCYRFQNGWAKEDFATSQGLLFLDLAGGNGAEKEGFTSTMAGINTMATNANIEILWDNAYRQISKYNNFLANIDKCPMDETKKKQWASEVKVLRAYFFFYLAFHFKDIPMPIEPLTVETANTIPQTSQADVYKQIETDLLEALNLPSQYDAQDYGRLTCGAVKVLLSRLYLAQNRWKDAADILNEIITSELYELDRRNGSESYEKLFQVGGEYSPETIFCIQGIADKHTTALYQLLYPEAFGGWHQFAPYNELVKEYFCADGKDIETSSVYDENDPYANREIRLYASIFLPPLGSFPGTEFNGQTYTCFNGPNTNDSYNRFNLFNGYSPKKSCDPDIMGNLASTPTYTPLMRYAEVLLSYLEALNESAPEEIDQKVLDLTINDIRGRVNLPGYTKAELPTQEAVRKAVRKERRVELAFEGFRYFDVLRWGIAKQELNHTFTGVKLSDDPNAPNFRGSGTSAAPVDENMYYQFETREWEDHNRYFPIPQAEINVNKNLKQNEGYK